MDEIILLAAIGALYYLAAGQSAEGDSTATDPTPASDLTVDFSGAYTVTNATTTYQGDPLSDPNVQAMIAAIGQSEGSGYNTFYGGSTFSNMSDHPVLTGEKTGIPLSTAMCAAAGLGAGCVSTAAGIGQINLPTWKSVRRDMGDGYGYLADFSPNSQNIAIIRLLRADGSLDALAAGDLQGAFTRAGKTWASLPNNSYGQHQNTLATLEAMFAAAGGSVTPQATVDPIAQMAAPADTSASQDSSAGGSVTGMGYGA